MGRQLNTPENFWSKVNRKGDNECWEWTAYILLNGYGQITYHNKVWGSHRLAYTFTHGDIPKEMVVMHTCDNPCCCNPAHLRLGTQADNVHDMISKGRKVNPGGKVSKVHKRKSSLDNKLTEDDVRAIRASHLTQAELGRKYNVTRANISHIVSGKTWKHVV
jgi:hypothetical protein